MYIVHPCQMVLVTTFRHQTLCGSYYFSYYSSMHQISTYSTRIQQLGFSADSSLTMMQTSLSWQQQLCNNKFYVAVIQQYSSTAVVMIQQYSSTAVQQFGTNTAVQQYSSATQQLHRVTQEPVACYHHA